MSIWNIAQKTGNIISAVRGSRVAGVFYSVKSKFERTPKVDCFEKNSITKQIPKKLSDFIDNYDDLDADAKAFYHSLFEAGEDKFDFIVNYKHFSHGTLPELDSFLESVKKVDLEFIEKTFNEVDEIYLNLPGKPEIDYLTGRLSFNSSYIPQGKDYARMLILKANQPETFTYLQDYPKDYYTLAKLFDDFSKGCPDDMFKTLTPAQIRQMDASGIEFKTTEFYDYDEIIDGKRALYDFVDSSDSVNLSRMKTADLHNYLSRHITLEDFTAFRSERDTGMFSNIPLDSKFESKTRLIALRKILKATDLDIHEYLGRYETSFAKTETLFDRIMTKEKLTLADAMEICRFAPDSYIDKVLELIKNVEIVDNRFKSLTFYKGMAEEWISDLSADNMKIMQNVTVKKGANGTYTGLNNKQAEFVLDNNDKLIRFVDAKYNKELGRFELDSIVENAT